MGPSQRPTWGTRHAVGAQGFTSATTRATTRDAAPRRPRHVSSTARRTGFTLIDVLVSLAVIGLLIGILLPSFAMVRESARRVMCASNLRQVGIGLHMYAQDSSELLPPSVFLPQSWRPGTSANTVTQARPELMDTVRTSAGEFGDRPWGQWDGLGLLFSSGHLTAPGVFYCPSHPGSHPLSRYEDVWKSERGEIISNYQFRGGGPDGQRRLYRIDPQTALVTDMLRSYEDLNHPGGFNLLQAGLAVSWFEDQGQQIAGMMLRGGDDGEVDPNAGQAVTDVWFQLDTPGSSSSSNSSPSHD